MNQSHALRQQEPVSPETRSDHNAPAAIRSPTEEEKREHKDNHHYPYQPWCPKCIGSKGRMRSHSSRKEKQQDEIPEVSWDFNIYMDGMLQTVNGRDRKTGAAISFAAHTKADNPWVSKKIHEELKLLGRTTTTLLKTDKESGLEGIF